MELDDIIITFYASSALATSAILLIPRRARSLLFLSRPLRGRPSSLLTPHIATPPPTMQQAACDFIARISPTPCLERLFSHISCRAAPISGAAPHHYTGLEGTHVIADKAGLGTLSAPPMSRYFSIRHRARHRRLSVAPRRAATSFLAPRSFD